jgi:N-acetylneuraminic acid mutarotase
MKHADTGRQACRLALVTLLFLAVVATGMTAIAQPLTWNTKAPLPVGTSRGAGAVIDGKLFVLGGATSTGITRAVYAFDPTGSDPAYPGGGAWQSRPPLVEPRFDGAFATQGSMVYIAGGGGSSTSQNTVLLYDTSSGNSSIAGYLVNPRSRASAAILNGKLYVVGGRGASGVLNTIEEFDLTTNTCTLKATLPAPRELAAVVALNGKLLIMGGADSTDTPTATSWEYDPVTNTFSSRASLHTPLMNRSPLVSNGKVYLIGGLTSTGFPPAAWTNDVQELDPATDTWSYAGTVPTSRYASSVGIITNSLYVVGGDASLPASMPQNLNVNEAAALASNWITRAPMPIPVSRAASATVNGMIYVLGGAGTTTSDAIQMYDPIKDLWQVKSSLPLPLFGAAGAAQDGSIFLAGGFDTQMNFQNAVYAYDVYLGSVRRVGSLVIPRARVNAAFVDKKLYVVGGSGPATNGVLDSIEEFDPSTGTSVIKTVMPEPRSLAGVTTNGGFIYVMGGYNGTGLTARCWRYDPRVNLFAPISPMPLPIDVRNALSLGSKIYVLGNYPQPGGSNPILEYDVTTDSWSIVESVPTPRDVPVAQISGGRLHVIGGFAGGRPLNVNEAMQVGNGWEVHSAFNTQPYFIDWSSNEHPPLYMDNYILIGSTYYFVANSWPGSWNGPTYTTAELHGCDQVTGAPDYSSFPDLRNSVGLPIQVYSSWPLPDIVPPTTTPTVTGSAGNNGWYTSDVQVTLSATDNPGGAGVAKTEYGYDGTNWDTFIAPVTIYTEGTTALYYRSTDKAGNVEQPTKALTVRIDKTAPHTNVILSGTTGLDGWYTSAVQVSLAAADNAGGSGLARTEYSFDGAVWNTYVAPFTVTSQETTTFYYRSVDNAGIKETDNYQTVKIDNLPPVVTAPPDTTAEATGLQTVVAIGSATATDNVGVVSLTSNAPATFPIGTTVVTWTARDAAGNTGTAIQKVTVRDTTPPVISGAATASPNANGWYSTNPIVHFTATDNGSGVDAVTPDVVLSTEGASQSVTGTATDRAGNSASFTVKGLNVDRTPPVISITGIQDGAVYLLNSVPTPGYTANDNLSGIESQNAFLTGVSPSGVGKYTYTVTAVDRAGNASIKSASYSVVYSFSGFLSPVNLGKPFKFGSTIPVKFGIADAGGNVIVNATATIALQKYSGDSPVGDPIEELATGGANAGNLFRYDPVERQYIFNLDTKGLSVGTWQIIVALDDKTTKTVFVSVR